MRVRTHLHPTTLDVSGSVNAGSIFNNGFPIPLITSRQGGSSTVYNTEGTTNYSMSGAPFIQMGRISIPNGGVSQWGGKNVTLTFPTAFSTIPIIFVSIQDGTNPDWYLISSYQTSTTTTKIIVNSAYNGSLTAPILVSWLAIGT